MVVRHVALSHVIWMTLLPMGRALKRFAFITGSFRDPDAPLSETQVQKTRVFHSSVLYTFYLCCHVGKIMHSYNKSIHFMLFRL